MADNVVLDEGEGGSSIRTDQDGNDDHWQYVKLAFGADNTQTIVGSISSNPLPVALSAVDNAVLDAIAASVGIMDDWDESDRAKVNLIAGQAGIAGGTGGDGATVPRVTLATDVGLPAGTNNIGDVDVLSVIPGVGPTNLGKAEDGIHASGDVGVMPLCVRIDVPTEHAPAGDYAPQTISEHGCVNVDAQHYGVLNDCDVTTGWTVINNDTDNLTTSTNHVWKTASLSFDKIDHGDNNLTAGIQRTISSTNLNGFIEEGGGFLLGSMFFTDVAVIDYVFMRVGTDSSNYNEWRVSGEDLVADQWNALRGVMRAPYASVGDGWSSSAVAWMSIGVSFTAETDTLAEILVDGLFVNSGLQTSSDITSQVSTSISTPNVRINGYLGSVPTGEGAITSGTQRITIATDDDSVAHLATIAGDTTSIDGNITACNTGAVVLATGSAAIGKLASNTGVDIGDVDVTSVVPGVGATNLGKAEDAQHANGDVGVMPLAVRQDSLSALAVHDGDYSPLSVNDEGSLYVEVADGALLQVHGAVEDGTPGGPVLVGGRYDSSPRTITDTKQGAIALTVAGVVMTAVSEALPAGTNTIGGTISQASSSVVYDGTTACTVQEFNVVGTTAGNNEIVAAVSGKKIRLLHLEMIAITATANTVYLVNDDYALVSTSSYPIPIAQDADGDNLGGWVSGAGWQRTTDTDNQAVVAVQSSTAAILYMGTYIEVD